MSRRNRACIWIAVVAMAQLAAAYPAGAAAEAPFPRPRPAGISTEVPLPRPRPAEDAADPPFPRSRPAEASAPASPSLPAEPDAPLPPTGPSECLTRLDATMAIVQPLPPITGPGECSADDVVRLDAVIMPDSRKVTLSPPAVLRCAMAEAVVRWTREAAGPAVKEHGSALTGIAVAGSFECRGRNRVAGAKLSQHGHANALDIAALLTAGEKVTLTDASASKPLREQLRASVCERFTTVLGPGSDGYHETHVHIDLTERRRGYRMCQWEVRSPP